MIRLRLAIVAAALLASTAAHSALVEGTPSNGLLAPTPNPLFGTLINFDDGITGTSLASNQYAALGVTSIANTLGPQLGYFLTSQSLPNYIGTGSANGWDADILVEFASLQAAVGIGIAGPTSLRFELLAPDFSVLEGYDLSTTPSNTYYYINRASNDVRYLRVAGDFIAIDDLQFSMQTVEAIPEPATWGLMIVGFGMVGSTMRLRSRRSTIAIA